MAGTIEQIRAELYETINAYFEDADLERYLQARKKEGLKAAVEMVQKSYTWRHTELPGRRKGVTADNIVQMTRTDNIAIGDFKESFPHAYFGYDKDGNPIHWEKSGIISVHWAKVKKSFSVDDLLVEQIRSREQTAIRMRYLSAKLGKPVTKFLMVTDCKGLVLNLDFDLIKYCRGMVTILQSYYPETLKRYVLINCPWFISAVFALISPWIDPVTREKFQFIGEDYQPVLKSFVDEENIPVEYGGTKSDLQWFGPWSEGSGVSETELDLYLGLKNGEVDGKMPGESVILPATDSMKMIVNENERLSELIAFVSKPEPSSNSEKDNEIIDLEKMALASTTSSSSTANASSNVPDVKEEGVIHHPEPTHVIAEAS